MKNKLKILWFGLVPLSWYLAFLLVKWVQYYPVTCSTKDSPIGLCIFLMMSAIFGTILLLASGIGLAIYLQD